MCGENKYQDITIHNAFSAYHIERLQQEKADEINFCVSFAPFLRLSHLD